MKQVLIAALCLAATPAAAQVWVEGNGRSCDIACGDRGLSPMVSGVHTNGQPYYMCAGNARGEGYRGGYNLRPSWSSSCNVGAGGQEMAASPYSCLCVAGAQQFGAGPVQQYSPQPVPVAPPPQPTGGRRIHIEEASYGQNCGLPRGNASAHVTRWCDDARDLCDYTIDPSQFGGPTNSCQAGFSVRYHCGSDGRPKVTQSTVSGPRGQIVLTCP